MAVEYDIVIDQGATWERQFGYADPDGTPIPLKVANGGTRDLEARMQVRRRAGAIDEADLFLSLTSVPVNGLWLDTKPNNALNVGFVWVRIGATATTALLRSGVYDLEIYDPADLDFVIRLVQGRATLDKQVTLP